MWKGRKCRGEKNRFALEQCRVARYAFVLTRKLLESFVVITSSCSSASCDSKFRVNWTRHNAFCHATPPFQVAAPLSVGPARGGAWWGQPGGAAGSDPIPHQKPAYARASAGAGSCDLTSVTSCHPNKQRTTQTKMDSSATMDPATGRPLPPDAIVRILRKAPSP